MNGSSAFEMVRVLVSGPAVRIGDQDFQHYPKGGGLVAVGAQVSLSAKIELLSIVHNNAKIHPDVEVRGVSVVEEGVTLAPGVKLLDCVIGRNSVIGVGVDIANITIPDNSDVKKRQGSSGGVSISKRGG